MWYTLAVEVDIGWIMGSLATVGSAILYFGRKLALFLKPLVIRGTNAHIEFVTTATEQITQQTTILKAFTATQAQHGQILEDHTKQLNTISNHLMSTSDEHTVSKG